MIGFLACVALFNALGLVFLTVTLRENVKTGNRNRTLTGNALKVLDTLYTAQGRRVAELSQRLTKLEKKESRNENP